MKAPESLKPPKWADSFLEWFCSGEVLETVQGDLHELYQKRRIKLGRTRAALYFIKDVFSVCRPFAFKKSRSTNPKPTALLQHTLLLAFRNFKRHKGSFFINLTGLSTGLTCTIMIYLWINDELSIDSFFQNQDRLFQVMQNIHHSNDIETTENTPGPLANTLAEEFPEVAHSVTVIPTVYNTSKGITSLDDVRIKSKAQYVTKDFFNVFPYRLIQGDKDQVLKDKSAVVISKELAVTLFNTTENVVGKTIEWAAMDINKTCAISGIFESPPSNATNQFDLLLSFELFSDNRSGMDKWDNNGPRTYLLLKKGASVDLVNSKISGLIKSKHRDSKGTLFLQLYSDRYLYGKYENGISVGGRIEYVKLFSLVAIFTLMIACINFMNLSTARASRRVKEIGVKKAAGAGRQTLTLQFLGESILISVLALVLAVIAVYLLLPLFNTVTEKHLVLSLNPNHITVFLVTTLITGLLAGSYPAFYLSKINLVQALKGRLDTVFGEVWARRGLVVFQFAISLVLIVSVMIAYWQIAFIQSKNLGYERDHVVHFDTEKPTDAFISELKSIPGVLNAGPFFHNLAAGAGHGTVSDIHWEGKASDDKTGFFNLMVGYGLIETLGLEITSGRAFSKDFASENQIIFNEAAIKAMGLKDPVGKPIRRWGQEYEIVGVVKNFHFESLHEKVKPCFLFLIPTTYMPNVMVKIKAGTERETLVRLEEFFKQHNPGLSFDYKFLDHDYQLQYKSEQNIATISGYFATIAILISCLGLFGLVSFTTERRIKEIGIRKILGCTDLGIIYLLSNEFTKIIMISITIALPLSYFITKNWLENFEYRIELAWWFFASSGVAVLLIAWATVGVQIFKTASINPSQSLRNG